MNEAIEKEYAEIVVEQHQELAIAYLQDIISVDIDTINGEDAIYLIARLQEMIVDAVEDCEMPSHETNS